MKDEYKEMVCRVRFIDGVPARTYLSDVEIVRCKDCKWSDWYTAGDGRTFCYCHITDTGGNEEDDFCSSAERKADADS